MGGKRVSNNREVSSSSRRAGEIIAKVESKDGGIRGKVRGTDIVRDTDTDLYDTSVLQANAVTIKSIYTNNSNSGVYDSNLSRHHRLRKRSRFLSERSN